MSQREATVSAHNHDTCNTLNTQASKQRSGKCGKCNKIIKDLPRHEREKHRNKEPIFCQHCGKQQSRKDNLKRHYLKCPKIPPKLRPEVKLKKKQLDRTGAHNLESIERPEKERKRPQKLDITSIIDMDISKKIEPENPKESTQISKTVILPPLGQSSNQMFGNSHISRLDSIISRQIDAKIDKLEHELNIGKRVYPAQQRMAFNMVPAAPAPAPVPVPPLRFYSSAVSEPPVPRQNSEVSIASQNFCHTGILTNVSGYQKTAGQGTEFQSFADSVQINQGATLRLPSLARGEPLLSLYLPSVEKDHSRSEPHRWSSNLPLLDNDCKYFYPTPPNSGSQSVNNYTPPHNFNSFSFHQERFWNAHPCLSGSPVSPSWPGFFSIATHSQPHNENKLGGSSISRLIEAGKIVNGERK